MKSKQKNKPTAGNPNWKKGMPSPNPKGRPVGIVDRRSKLNDELLGSAEEILKNVISQAKRGDLHAASLVLSRVLPKLGNQASMVNFTLDVNAPLSIQVEQVLAATANGKLPPDSAKQIIELISFLGEIRKVDEFDRRIKQLEKSHVK